MTRDKNHEEQHLKEIQAAMNKRFGDGTVLTLDQDSTKDVASTSTGSLTLDRALGTGGYPKGRIIELFGPESSGKTTLTLHAIASVQAQGGTAAFIDAEHAMDSRYAKALGVDLRRLLVTQPDCGEQGLDVAAALVESGAVDLVVVDSVAALVPKAEIDGEMGDNHVGLHARLMGRGVRRITADAHRTGTTVLFINQLRQKIGVTFGSNETTTGGNALRFFASVRLDVRRIGKASAGEQVVGNRTRVRVVKNKLAAPFQEAEFDIRWGTGVDRMGELIELGLEQGVVSRAGAHFSYDGESLGQGRERARQALLDKSDLASRLELAVGFRADAGESDGVQGAGTGTEGPGIAAAPPPEPGDGSRTRSTKKAA